MALWHGCSQPSQQRSCFRETPQPRGDIGPKVTATGRRRGPARRAAASLRTSPTRKSSSYRPQACARYTVTQRARVWGELVSEGAMCGGLGFGRQTNPPGLQWALGWKSDQDCSVANTNVIYNAVIVQTKVTQVDSRPLSKVGVGSLGFDASADR